MLPLDLTVRRRRLLAALAACVVVGILVVRHHGASGAGLPLRVAPVVASPGGVAQGAATAAGGLAATGTRTGAVLVDVVGAVRRPGVYRLGRGARVGDAVARAGGLTRRAERAAVNFAAPVSDGQQVVVATRGSPGAAPVGSTAGDAGPVSLSSATAEQLDTLPGVGPVTAQKIIDYRAQHGPFTSVEALDAIPGIGPARIAELQGLVVP